MSHRPGRGAVLPFLAVVAASCAVGAVAGWLWELLWTPPIGIVFDGRWFFDPTTPDVAFSASGLYVVVALLAGLVLGALVGWRRGHELAVLAGAVVGSAAGAWVMYAVGRALGPPDPRALAGDLPDYSQLPAAPEIAGWVVGLAMPLGVVTSLTLIYLSGVGRRRRG